MLEYVMVISVQGLIPLKFMQYLGKIQILWDLGTCGNLIYREICHTSYFYRFIFS